MNNQDLDQITNVLRRAMCLHLEAVKSTATLEVHPDRVHQDTTHLSRDPKAREGTYMHFHGRGVTAFLRAGIPWTDVRLQGRWVEPYRRKVASELRHAELRRVNEVVARLREGLMMALLNDGFSTWFDTEDGIDVARRLFRAFVEWDYPAVAAIVDEHPALAERLSQVLALTDEELIAMACLDDDAWYRLGDTEQSFTRYYRKRSA